jgi:DNA-binding CsgD family transcriptional regulator
MPALTVLAVIAVRRGQPDADAILDEAWALVEPTGEAQRQLPVLAARAEAAWTAGRGITAEPTWTELLKHGNSWAVGESVWWARRAGIDEPAPHPCAEPFELMLAGRAADAARAWTRISSPFWHALALTESDLPADVREGVEQLRSLGADATVRAVLRDLHAAGKPVPRARRPASRTDPAGLTARELDVLRLAAEGHDNSAIAVSLTLSVRTVERHLHNAYLKLGVQGKSARAAAVARLMARP